MNKKWILSFRRILPSLIAVFLGLFTGIIFMVIVGIASRVINADNVREGIRIFLLGIFSKGRDSIGRLIFGFNPVHIGNMLFRATPLIMCGLSVAISMKAGMFNIGVPGQYLIGTMATLFLALKIPSESVSPVFIWIIAFTGGMLSAGVWGAIPGFFKAFLNINEVLCGILTNWIAANLVTLVFEGSDLINVTEASKSGFIYKTATNGVSTPTMGLDRLFPGSQVNGGILIAIVFAVFIFFYMDRTTEGFRLKTTGANRDAAKYAGINDRRALVSALAVGGALAGAGAALYYLSGNTEFYWSTYQSLPAVGFNGIPAALLANCHPVGIIFSSLFLSALEISGVQLANYTPYNEYVANLVIAIIVYLSSFSLVVAKLIKKAKKAKEEA